MEGMLQSILIANKTEHKTFKMNTLGYGGDQNIIFVNTFDGVDKIDIVHLI